MSIRQRKEKELSRFGTLFLTSFLSASVAYADPVGIVGGTDLSNQLYAVLLTDLNGSILPVSGLPSSMSGTSLNQVDINNAGLSLIGGRDDFAAYAAFVSSDGIAAPITLNISTGEVLGLAINESGLGLLGVHNISLNDYFATFVTFDGDVTPVALSDDLYSIDLNNAGVGLIGGEGGDAYPYASYVTTGGVTPITLSMLPDWGHTTHVAINDSGSGIISAFTFSGTYAAFVYPNNSSLALAFPSGNEINAVAINNAGAGLIGGNDGGGNAYAGFVALDGAITSLISAPFSGNINSVALNDSGMGLIGGVNGSDFYAALVQPGNSLLPIFDSPENGSISSVAINSAGVGLIGGQAGGTTAYAALVAPDGTLTPLILSGASINSVALAKGASIIDEVVPATLGPYSSIFYNHLAIASALNTRFNQQNRIWAKNGSPANSNTASNEIDIARLEANLAYNPQMRATPKQPCANINPNSFWFEPFGDLFYISKQDAIPAYSNQVAGGLVGYDRQGTNYIVGASAGYAFNYVHISEGVGHAKIQEEVFSLYGLWYTDHFWIALSLSGGPYQVSNIRHFLQIFTAKSKSHGWILDPHLEIATPWALDQRCLYYIEPFAQCDWINSWQHHYTETGATGFNLQVPSDHSSLLQSEAGLRFYEQFLYGWGKLCLEQKLSYINQTPFGVNPQNVAFVSSAASFPVALASSKMQNLGSAQLLACFVPQNPSRPYGGFSFEGTAGSSYQSYFASLFLGVDF